MPKYNVLNKDGEVILELDAANAAEAKAITEKYKIEGAVKIVQRPAD